MACVAYGCKSHSSKKSDENRYVTYHRFPANKDLKSLWIKAIRREDWEPSKYSRLCSKHFLPKCYVEGLNKRTLRANAVPSIFHRFPKQLPMKPLIHLRHDLYENEAEHEPSTTVTTITSSVAGDEVETPREKTLKKLLIKEKDLSHQRFRQIKNLKQKCRRMQKKIDSLKTMVNENNEQSIVNAEHAHVLMQIGEESEILKRYVAEKIGHSLSREYSPEIKKFALILNYLSPKAYAYVRQQFLTILPHPNTIAKWFKSGMLELSMESLESMLQETINDNKPAEAIESTSFTITQQRTSNDSPVYSNVEYLYDDDYDDNDYADDDKSDTDV